MLEATIVTTRSELLQIHQLNQLNLKTNLNATERTSEGFVTWLYSMELLEKMNELAPSIIVKDGEKIAGYALATPIEASAFHPDLKIMFKNLEKVLYKNKPLSSYHFYCMGQICVAKEYRGKGVVDQLYQQHKKSYSPLYQFILTEISTGNERSLKAHRKIGFETIHTYRDSMDEWAVVVWDWNEAG